MTGKVDRIQTFLKERDIRSGGLVQDFRPTAGDVWQHVVRHAVTATERVSGNNFTTLEAVFERIVERLSLCEKMPVLLNIAEFGGAWVSIELPEHRAIIRRFCVRPDEPFFVLASPTRRVMLALSTEECEYLLFAARWEDDGTLVPLAASDISFDKIDEVLNSWPPDYGLDGADVEAMIHDMPGRPHMPERLPDRFKDNGRRPPSAREVPVFDERMIEALFHAVNYLRQEFKRFRGEWPLSDYDVHLSWYSEHDLVDVAFCPKFEMLDQGSGLEVVGRDSPGIEFVLSSTDYSLVRRVYMK